MDKEKSLVNQTKQEFVKLAKKIKKDYRKFFKQILLGFAFLTVIYGGYLAIGYLVNMGGAFYNQSSYLKNAFYIAFYTHYLIVLGYFLFKKGKNQIILLYLLAVMIWFY